MSDLQEQIKKQEEDLARELSGTLPAIEAWKKAREIINKQGITKIANGECPTGATLPIACTFCPYGHMLECHYPQTCEEAKCSHYQQEMEAEGDSFQQFWNLECCSGTGHTIKEGGSHVNFVVLDKKGTSKYMVAIDAWLDGKERPPRAMAVLCDKCQQEGRKPLWAVVRDDGDKPIYRIPVAELEDWSYEEV
jgi:hypothetical protein